MKKVKSPYPHIERRKNGHWVEWRGIGKFFETSATVDIDKTLELAESFGLQIQIFTDPKRSRTDWVFTFNALKNIVDALYPEFEYEGIEGFSAGDFTYFEDLERSTIGVNFGRFDVYVSNKFEGRTEYVVEIITGYIPKKTTVVCSGVSAETVVAIVRNSPANPNFQEPVLKQLFFSPANRRFFNSVRLTD